MTTISTEFRLTGFGKTFTSGGALRGYGYVRGGMTGYLPGTKAKPSPALDSLRAAVASGDLAAVRAAAKRLPSVRITQDRAGGVVTVSRHGAQLCEWALTPRRLDLGWAAPDAVVAIEVNEHNWAA